MKKYSYSCLLFAFSLLTLFSCSKDEIEIDSNSLEQNLVAPNKARSLVDSIIPLDPDDFPNIDGEAKFKTNSSVFSYLYELEGIEFYLQSKNSYFGNNTLQSNGKGNEIELASYNTSNNAQLFYLEYLPISTGIPFLIYSYKEQKPIGVGSYPNDPNNYILYTQHSGSTDLFGFAWDFYLNTNKDGYTLENQDVIGSGSGGAWDIYYYAIESKNGNLNLVETNNNSVYQQFNIIPNDDFTVESVYLDYHDAQITNTSPFLIKDGTVENNTSNDMQQTLTFSETESESTSFRETNGITTKKTGNLNLGISLFKIVEIGGSYNIEQSSQETVEYSNSSSRDLTVTESFNIVVPPQTIVTYKLMVTKHAANVAYTAEVKGVSSQKVMEITGIYSGVDYSSTYLEVTETPVGNHSNNKMIPVTYNIYPNGKD